MQNYDHYPKLFLKIWTSIVKIRTLCAKSQFYKYKKIGGFDKKIESTDLYPFFSSTRPHSKKQPSTIPSAWQKAVSHAATVLLPPPPLAAFPEFAWRHANLFLKHTGEIAWTVESACRLHISNRHR